ncbi:MAG: S8 family peptidase [Acidothermaceae bacterium]
MRLDHAARLERMLARHDDIQVVDGASGNGTLIRKDQLLVVGRDADEVHSRASRWVESREDDAAGFAVLHLRPSAKVDVCELTTTLSGDSRHKRVNAGPNHILMAAPHWGPGPFDDPAPVSIPPADPATGLPSKRDVVVAVLDTGIAAHPWFADRKWFADCGDAVREQPDVDQDSRLDSVAGHGTFIAGIVVQHAPDAAVKVGRIITGDGSTDELELLRGLARLRASALATNVPIDVISLSLGCYTHDDKPSPVVEHAFNSLDPDTVVVCCAGNCASDRPFWPAALKRVIAVGSLDARGHDRAEFSNYGWWVDACAIGDKVVSSFFTFDDHGPDGDENFNGFAEWSGTSFAAPRVAAAIATIVASDDVPASRAAARLLNTATNPSMPDLGVLVDAPAGGISA